MPFVVLHPLPVSVGPSPFSGVGVVFGHALVTPPATLVLVSSDARSHIPDAFASSSTPISGSWMVLAPVFFMGFALGSSFSLPVLAAGSG